MDIYIKPKKKVVLYGAERSSVFVKDAADVFAPKDVAAKINAVKIFTAKTDKKRSYVLSVVDIIKAIDAAVPGGTINNVGEQDTLVSYSPKTPKNIGWWKWTKIAVIALIMMTGSATAIMSFHSDAQLPEIFKNVYYIFFREKVDNPALIEIPYTIGVAAGIIVFFNHFAGKKITSDPTPIEVEMAIYESDTTDAIIDALNAHADEADKPGRSASNATR